jgi:hypothetical protein
MLHLLARPVKAYHSSIANVVGDTVATITQAYEAVCCKMELDTRLVGHHLLVLSF